MALYNVKNLFDKNPVQISGAIVAVLNVPVIAGVVELSGSTVGAINTALVAVLGLFVVSKTTNTAALEEAARGE